MMNRRHFIGAAAGAAAMAAAVSARRLLAAGVPLGPIGLELSTVRYDFLRDPEATLAAVATTGCHDVELYGLYEPEAWLAPQLRGALDRAGLTASAVHVTTPLLYRGLDRHLDVAAALGCRYMVCGHVDLEERRTLRDWHELAALFNRSGEVARRAGLRIGYHNHSSEFGPVDGHIPYDLLLAETDPALVWFELDPAVVRAAGGDAVGVVRQHGGRMFALHVGDVDAGAGTTEVAPLLAAAHGAGVERYYVAIDPGMPAPIERARRSVTYLRGLRF
jgi:sugar phosphate isomerase/epimerase